jgi:arabinofuranan 3-O-arabinosyltransferase
MVAICRGAAAPPPDARNVGRSLRLLRAFRQEQSHPEQFAAALAQDVVAQLSRHRSLTGALVLDIGSGPGWYRAVIEQAGARYVGVEPDSDELSEGLAVTGSVVRGDGRRLPLRDGCVDIVVCSNVLEHVADPEQLADELLRVVRPGGFVHLSYTLWLSPWGGHETSPWHYLGGARAERRYRRRNGYPPKNRYGKTLFPLSASRMLRWARNQPGVDVVEAVPRYHPAWLTWVVRVPVVREVASWNLLLVLRKQ